MSWTHFRSSPWIANRPPATSARLSASRKPHVYDPATNPELFEGVLARRMIAFIIDVVVIAAADRCCDDLHLRIRHLHVRTRLGPAVAAARGRGDLGRVVLRLHTWRPRVGDDRHARRWISKCAPGTARRATFVLGAVHAIVFWISVSMLTPFVLLVGLVQRAASACCTTCCSGTVVINNPDRAARLAPRRLEPSLRLCRLMPEQAFRLPYALSILGDTCRPDGYRPEHGDRYVDPAFAQYAAVLSDGAVALPLPRRARRNARSSPISSASARPNSTNSSPTAAFAAASRSPTGRPARPAAPASRCACWSTNFMPTRSMRRVLDRNRDIIGDMRDRRADLGAIFGLPRLSRRPPSRRRHGRHDGARLRHDGRGQPRRHPHRRISPARPRQRITGRGTGELLAVALTDVLGDGLSMVYSFFEPDAARRARSAPS